jgi:protein-tyrosine phosphatase
MAEGLARTLADATLTMASAGLETADGLPPARDAVTAMSEIRIDIRSHRSRQIDKVDLGSYDAVVALDKRIADALLATHRVLPGRLRNLEVDDPYGRGLQVYRACRDELRRKLQVLLRDPALGEGPET